MVNFIQRNKSVLFESLLLLAGMSSRARQTTAYTTFDELNQAVVDGCVKDEAGKYPKCKIKFHERDWRKVVNVSCINPNTFVVPAILVVNDVFQKSPPVMDIYCVAPFPLHFEFKGPGIFAYSKIKKTIVNVDPRRTRLQLDDGFHIDGYEIQVEALMIPAGTGKYIVRSATNLPRRETVYFVFISKLDPPFLIGAGQKQPLFAEFVNNSAPQDTIIIPCITANLNVTVNLFRKKTPDSVWKQYFEPEAQVRRQYVATEGFIIPHDDDGEVFKCSIDTNHTDFVEIVLPFGTSKTSTQLVIETVWTKIGTDAFCYNTNSNRNTKFYNEATSNTLHSQFIANCLIKGYSCGQDYMNYMNSMDSRGPYRMVELKDIGETCANNSSCSRIRTIQENGVLVCISGTDLRILEYFTGLDYKIYGYSISTPVNTSVLIRLKYTIQLNQSDKYGFQCDRASYIFAEAPTYLSAKYLNGTGVILRAFQSTRLETFRAFLPLELDEIICSALLFTTFETINSSAPLTTYSNYFPRILGISPAQETFIENTQRELICEVDERQMYLVPRIEWWFKNTKIEEKRLRSVPNTHGFKLAVRFPSVSSSDEGVYICFARNVFTRVNRTFTVRVTPEEVDSTLVYILVPASALGFVIFLVSTRLLWHNLLLKRILSDLEVEEFQNGAKTAVSDCSKQPILDSPYNKKYEIQRRQIKINKSKILGTGEFGIVYSGTVVRLDTFETVEVAVKTMKPDHNATCLKSQMTELKVLAHLDNGHSSILNIIGACTSRILYGEIYICVEPCRDSLLNILRRSRNGGNSNWEIPESLGIGSSAQSMPSEKVPEIVGLKTNNLTRWAHQIASGMEFMHQKRVIHGDLAARNILITFEYSEVKIADFGLGRVLDNYLYFKDGESAQPLPWRWMSIEALAEGKFSYASDVWAFGVTLWEIYSFGENPYAGLEWSAVFIEELKGGLRLKNPVFGPEKLHSISTSCWAQDPTDRPNFTKIKNDIANTLGVDDSGYSKF